MSLTWPSTSPGSTERRQTREVAIRSSVLLSLAPDFQTDPPTHPENSIRTSLRETSSPEATLPEILCPETNPPEMAIHSEKATRTTDLPSRERKALMLPEPDFSQEVPTSRINSKEAASRERSEKSESSEASEEAGEASSQDSDQAPMKETEEEKEDLPTVAMEEEAEVAWAEEEEETTREAQEEKMMSRAAPMKEMSPRRL